MLTPVNIIVVTQQGAGRDLEITFNFCNEFHIESTWEDLTSTAEVILPRKIYAKDKDGKLQNFYSKDFNVGGFNNDNPFIMRGDKVQIYAGYRFVDLDGTYVDSTGLWFDGYISDIATGKPFGFKCEDAMWKLKQTPAKDKVWKGYTVEKMLSEMCANTGITVRTTTETSIKYDVGYFTTKGDSVAQALAKLKKGANIYSYIRNGELRVGFPLYDENEASNPALTFQKNIIDSDLQYRRKEDVALSARVHTIDDVSNGTTKDGAAKTKKKKVEYLIYYKNGVFTKQEITAANPAPENVEGQRYDFTYYQGTSVKDMIDNAEARLKKFYYTGYIGTIETFGYPFIQHGDNLSIVNPVLVEMNGTYKIKKVEYKGGVNGLRQIVTLDYKTSI